MQRLPWFLCEYRGEVPGWPGGVGAYEFSEWYLTFVNVMLDADAVINNSSQKVSGSNAYPDPAPKKVGGSGPRKTHRIYAPADR